MKKIIFALLTISLLSFSSYAFAEQAKEVPNAKAKPAVVVKDVKKAEQKDGVAIVVEHVGDDEMGGTLALKLKESFRKSVLFKLADKSLKSIRIKVLSRSEFSERPEIGSIYAVIWTFAESEDVVPFYLSETIGTVNLRTVETTAAKLMNATDKIADQYKFLFQ
ncbi:hypothetical protein [Maridesulfovibrio frigidus]|uniref:hypothetical protein n=1 Tax=Maridesulfovibrio frigidus TaxID=340956 RepID=UPI000A622266|nr:hypothetical protein [Maridesulfovibrio frigidus]